MWVICSDVNEPRVYHREWSKSEREKQILCIYAYIWNLEEWYRLTYLRGRNRDADIENRLWTQWGMRGWDELREYFGHLMWRVDSLEDSDAGRDWGQEEKRMTEDEMAGWHHRLDGCEFEWTPGVGDGQGGLVCCSSSGRKESDTTEQLNWTELNWTKWVIRYLNIMNISC